MSRPMRSVAPRVSLEGTWDATLCGRLCSASARVSAGRGHITRIVPRHADGSVVCTCRIVDGCYSEWTAAAPRRAAAKSTRVSLTGGV